MPSPLSSPLITARPRLGQISFLNALPIVLPIERKYVPLEADFHSAEPGQLNAAIETNQLDVSAVSSFYYLQNNSLVLIPGISISCINEVGSVLLFSKIEPHKLADSTILVPRTSATSVALLKISLLEKYGISPQLVRESSGAEDAVCLFGDEALTSDASLSQNHYRCDLGSWWHELTGLPMVFAVWAAGKAWCANNPQSIDSLSRAFQSAAAAGLKEMFDDVLSEAHRRSGIPTARLRNYYKKQLNFDLSDEHLKGLNAFRDLCLKHELLP